MDRIGLTEEKIAKRLDDQLYATNTVVATFEGKITDSMEVADNQAISRAIELAVKLRGLTDNDDHNHGGGKITMTIVHVGGNASPALDEEEVHEPAALDEKKPQASLPAADAATRKPEPEAVKGQPAERVPRNLLKLLGDVSL